MPRPLNPGTISTGGGLASPNSVDADALVHPTQGLDGLIAHIEDPSRAHMARAIGLVDAGGFYTSDDVEGALQEIGGGLADSGQNGLISGGTYAAVGLNVTLNATVVRIGIEHDLTGATATLTNTATNWLYVTPAGVLSVSVGAAPPSITAPENVLLWRLVTAGGVITAFSDARWFVLNLDRKLPLTVRSVGADPARHSEAAFESIEAAVLYLAKFGGGEIRNSTVVLKGPQTIAATIVVPVDNVTFVGEDGCVLTTGATLAPMFDLAGRTAVRFRDIVFTCANAGSAAIGNTSGTVTDVVMERCSVATGGSVWDYGLDFNQASLATDIVVRSCQITAGLIGVRIQRAARARVLDSFIQNAAGGTYGVQLGDTPVAAIPGGVADSVIRGCEIVGFNTGIFLRTVRTKVQGNTLRLSAVAVEVASSCLNTYVTDNTIVLDSTVGMTGVLIDNNVDDVQVRGGTITNPRGAGTYLGGDIPTGVAVGPTGCNRPLIADCTISGFYNSVGDKGRSISVGDSTDASIHDCNLTTAHYGIFSTGSATGLKVRGCRIADVVQGIQGEGLRVSITDTSTILSATLGLTGITISNGADDSRIIGCHVENPRAAYGGGDVPIGITVATCVRVQITDCTVRSFRNTATPTLGTGINVTGVSTELAITGGVIDTTPTGIFIGGGADRARISSVRIQNVDTGINTSGSATLVTGGSINLDSATGLTGIRTSASNMQVTGCRLNTSRVAWGGGDVPRGVWALGLNCQVSNCHIEGFNNPAVAGMGVDFDTGSSGGLAADCTILNCFMGVQAENAALAQITVTGCIMSTLYNNGVTATRVTGLVIANNQFFSPGIFSAIGLTDCNEFEVLGNRINGNAGATDTGILVTGLDSGGNRTRNFTIGQNEIKEFGGHGIFLQGYVQNGTVNGNQIDGFLPAAPSDPTAIAGIHLSSTAATNKVAYVTVQGNSVWRCQNGILLDGIIGNRVESCTVDGNVVHHCAHGTNGAFADIFLDPSMGIGLFYALNCTVTDNQVTKIGILINNSDVESFPSVTNVESVGIRMLNCDRLTVVSNNIRDCVWKGAAGAVAIQHDLRNNGGAFNSANTVINDNVIDVAVGGLVMLGILLHGGQNGGAAPSATTLRACSISGNTIKNTNFYGLQVVASGNCTVAELIIQGNVIDTVTDASGDAMFVGADPTGASGAGTLSLISIVANTITNSASRGIHVIAGADAGAGTGSSVTDITLDGNVISVPTTFGILVEGRPVPAAFGKIHIRGNTIRDPGTNGIDVLANGLNLAEVLVSDNIITWGGGFAAGLSVTTTAAATGTRVDLTDVLITSNQIVGSGIAALIVTANGLLTSITIADNFCEASASIPIAVGSATYSGVGPDTFHDGISITGNNCLGGFGSELNFNTVFKLRNLLIEGNTFRSATASGLTVLLDGAAAGSEPAGVNWRIVNNTFRDTQAEGLLLSIGPSGPTDPVRSVLIGGNQFQSCSLGAGLNATLAVTANGVVAGWTIVDNQFDTCGTTDDDALGILDLHLGATTTPNVADLTINRNSIRSCFGSGVRVAKNGAAADFQLINVSVCDNEMRSLTNTAILLILSAATDVECLDVSSNRINAIASTAVQADAGITILGPSANTLRQLGVRNNVIRATGLVGVAGIEVNLGATGNGIVIDNNNVSNAQGTKGGIYLNMDDLGTNISVSHNAVTNPTNDGIQVSTTTKGPINLSVNANEVSGAGANGINVNSVGNGVNDAITSSTVSNNSVYSPTDDGILVLMVGTGAASGLTIIGNQINGAGTHGIEINDNGVDLRDFIINDNGIRTVQNDGILIGGFAPGNIDGLTINDNMISNWCASAAAHHGAIHMLVFVSAINAVTISGNSCRAAQAFGIGHWLDLTGPIRCMTLTGNATYLGGSANTESLRFDTGAGADQAVLAITGNAYYDAATGVNFSASSFAPDRSVVVGNVERTSGGAGNWAAFTAPFTNSSVANNQN